jgi:hypothetical protein
MMQMAAEGDVADKVGRVHQARQEAAKGVRRAARMSG